MAPGVASMARILTRVETRTRLLSTVDIVTAIPSISRDAARIITAPSAIPSLYLVSFSEPAAPTAPRARASAAATAAVERADEALLYARLGFAVVLCERPSEKTKNDIGAETLRMRRQTSRRPARARSVPYSTCFVRDILPRYGRQRACVRGPGHCRRRVSVRHHSSLPRLLCTPRAHASPFRHRHLCVDKSLDAAR